MREMGCAKGGGGRVGVSRTISEAGELSPRMDDGRLLVTVK